MSTRVQAALEATGLYDKYFERFVRSSINDMAVNLCLKMSMTTVELIMACPEDYELFIKAFVDPHSVPVVTSSQTIETTSDVDPDHDSEINIDIDIASDTLVKNELSSTSESEGENLDSSHNKNSYVSTQDSSDNFQDTDSVFNHIDSNSNSPSQPLSQPTQDPDEPPVIHESFKANVEQVNPMKPPNEQNTLVLDSELQNLHKTEPESTPELFQNESNGSSENLNVNSEEVLLERTEEILNQQSLDSHALESALRDASPKLNQFLEDLLKKSNSPMSTESLKTELNAISKPKKSKEDLESESEVQEDNKESFFNQCQSQASEYFQKLLHLDNLDSCPEAKKVFQEVFDAFRNSSQEVDHVPIVLDIEEPEPEPVQEVFDTLRNFSKHVDLAQDVLEIEEPEPKPVQEVFGTFRNSSKQVDDDPNFLEIEESEPEPVQEVFGTFRNSSKQDDDDPNFLEIEEPEPEPVQEVEPQSQEIAIELWNKYRSALLQKIHTPNTFISQEQLQGMKDSTRQDIISILTETFFKDDLPQLSLTQNLFLQHIETEENNEYFNKIVLEQNEKFLNQCSLLIYKLLEDYSTKLESIEEGNFQKLSTIFFQTLKDSSAQLKSVEGFSTIPPEEAQSLYSSLSESIYKKCQDLIDTWYPIRRKRLLQSYKDSLATFCNLEVDDYGCGSGTEKVLKEDQELLEEHEKRKSLALEEFKTLLEQLPLSPFSQSSSRAKEESQTLENESELLKDFETEIQAHFQTILDSNNLLKLAREESSQGCHMAVEDDSSSVDSSPRNSITDVTENEMELNLQPKSQSQLSTEPVQIIDIPLRTENEGGSLIFRQQNLKEILAKVGRRPVALLSIAGPSRQGKSFILGYMIRYLQSLSLSQGLTSDNDNDWMGRSKSKQDIPLEQGFAWRPGVERETKGMWMWPQPFTLRREDGFEFDVLLMDTQGVFDNYTDKKDWATIVGLSLLTSSCLIFNIMNNLQEDSLITLKDFMEFGLMAKSQDDSVEKPFQKLLFLIRDWNSPDDYNYGRDGGSGFIKWNLEKKNTESGTQLRSQIQQCFQDLECYLMPDPGFKVKRRTYNGSVTEMDPEFAENIERFIEHLFDPSTFPTKSIGGNFVTGEDLLLVFEQYVKIFNSDQMPSLTDMNQANAHICNQTILNKCLVIYEECIEKQRSLNPKLFMLEQDLEKCHESALEETLAHFQSSRKIGSKDDLSKLRTSLTTRCEASYKLTCAENYKVQIQTVQMAIPKLENFFRNIIAEKMTEAFTGEDDLVPDDVFHSVYNECEILSCNYFKDVLQLENLDLLPLASSIFQSTLEFLKESVDLQNKMRRGEAENRMKEEVAKLSSEYKSLIEKKLQDFKYWNQAQIQKEEASIRTAVYQNLSSLFKDSCLCSHGRKLLTQEIQKEFKDIHKFVELQNKNYIMSVNFLVSELVTGYTLKMEECAQTTGLLGDIHTQERKKCLDSLSNFDNFDRLLPQDAEQILQDLTSRIDTTCQLLVNKWFPRIRQNFIRHCKDEINSFYGDGSIIFDKEKLQEKHEVLKEQVLQKFKNFYGSIPVPVFTDDEVSNQASLTPAKIMQDFESELDNYMEAIYEKNALRAEAEYKTVNGFMSKAKNKYLELASDLNSEFKNSEEFDKTSHKLKDFVLQYFEEQCEANFEESFSLEPSFRHLKEEFMNSVPEFKRVGENTLQISGKVLKCSRELVTLDNILAAMAKSESTNQNRNAIHIKEVWWVAEGDVYLDENLCGEFWSGMNLVIKSKRIVVVGNERLIIVSGENGRSASPSQPPTATQPCVNGINGTSGFPGENGGNISIQAEEIEGVENLRLISNGGKGGNGQPGGNGSKGKDGVGGDARYQSSLEFLKKNFPSPAKFIEATVQLNLKKGLETMKKIAKDNESETNEYNCCNSWSTCLSVKTREGAVFRYGFFQGGLKGLVSGRSFYVWFEGAPGVLGQRGGIGGRGGKGGEGGNPGTININFGKGNSNNNVGGEQVNVLRKWGANGADGRDGRAGEDGTDGPQGTDYAIVDPYAGFYVPNYLYSKKKFMGRLEMVVGVKSKKDAAYCPHRKKYISFVATHKLRPGLKIFEDPVDFDSVSSTS